MSDSENEPKNEREEDSSSGSDVEDNDDDIETEKEYEGGAVKKKIITKGEGWEKPKSGADVTVHYVGTLLDGTPFDSSRERGTPFNFKLGQGQVIKGWDKGVATMKKGEKAVFTIAASHAYGERGQGAKIPPNATLVFEVELLSWTSEEDVTKGGEVKKTTTHEGKGWEKPDELSSCTVKYSLQAGGKYVIGGEKALVDATVELAAVDTPEGLVEALKKMKKGERATVTVAASYGYSKEGNSALKVGPDADLVYDVELVDFPESPKTYTMKPEEKLAHGNKLKEVGNAFFKKDKFKRAQHFYEEAANVFQHEKNLEGAVKKQVDQLTEAAKGNLSACHLKLGLYAETVKVASEVLELDNGNVKALFRRAQAYHALKDFDEALEDLKAVIEKEGKTTAVVAKLLKEVKAEVAKERNAQAKIFGGMFSKLSLVSDKEVAEAQARAAEAKRPAPDSSDDDDDDEPPAMDEATQEAKAPAAEPEQVRVGIAKAQVAEEPVEDAGEGEGEELTPEQAAAMAAMNDELFGIVEEGQAGLAAAAKEAVEAPKEEAKPKEAEAPKAETKAEEPAVTVHVPAAAAKADPPATNSAAPAKAAEKAPKAAAKGGDNKKPAGKGKGKK